MNLTAGERADVLVVEDDPGDALLIQESFGPAEASNRRCHLASHRDQALRFARRTGEFANAPRPKLILLDLNLGETHGLDVLAELKSGRSWRRCLLDAWMTVRTTPLSLHFSDPALTG